MLVLHKKTGNCELCKFSEIINYLNSDDLIVFNDTKVMKARLYGRKNGTGAKIEILMLEHISDGLWKCMAKPGKRLKEGTEILLAKSDISQSRSINIINKNIDFRVKTLQKNKNDGTWIIDFKNYDIQNIQEICGHVPLPPYIKRNDIAADASRYQTVFAEKNGAVAAPTAGLHFTDEILRKLSEKNIRKTNLTLHVGAGTFKPVDSKYVQEHQMHTENYYFSPESAAEINRCRNNGGKILAVGTTSVRVLESCADKSGKVAHGSGKTDIFIYPPYKAKAVDMLLTNFHLPKSTLLMLVSAFAGRENVLNAYKLAVKEKFRFYSYGDCMLII